MPGAGVCGWISPGSLRELRNRKKKPSVNGCKSIPVSSLSREREVQNESHVHQACFTTIQVSRSIIGIAHMCKNTQSNSYLMTCFNIVVIEFQYSVSRAAENISKGRNKHYQS